MIVKTELILTEHPRLFLYQFLRRRQKMINTEITTTKGMEQAQRQMEQAKNRMALEKKKANEERRRRENAHKYMMGGVVHKYFQECYCFEESEMNEILKVALATPQCQKVIADIKARATNQVLSSPAESEVKSNESERTESR